MLIKRKICFCDQCKFYAFFNMYLNDICTGCMKKTIRSIRRSPFVKAKEAIKTETIWYKR